MRKLNTHDLFNASRLIKAMGCKELLTDIYNLANKGMKAEEVGIMMIASVFEALDKEGVENAFCRFLSEPFEMTIEEVKSLSPLELMNLLKELYESEDKESWKAFMHSLVSMMR